MTTLHIAQIDALARRHLRGEFQDKYVKESDEIKWKADRDIYALEREARQSSVGYLRALYAEEHKRKETEIRIKRRVDLANLFAKLAQEQEAHDADEAKSA